MTRRFFHKPVQSVALSGSVLFCLVAALAIFCPVVSAAGWTYLDPGVQPTLSAHAAGDTRYYPGDSFAMTVVLTNRGKETNMQVAPLMSPGIYDPSTALGVTVRPRAADAPVTLKSLPVIAGDIGSLGQAPVVIRGTVHQNASPGIYVIPLEVTYQYVYAIPMVGADFNTVDMLYREKAQTLMATLRIQAEVRPAILSENATNLVPGTQGYLTANIENIGYATGSEVAFGIVPADNVTFQMVDQSVYIGTFSPGNVTPIRARIAVKEHTGAGSYPAVLVGQYRDADGVFRATPEVPLGIPVGKGAVIDVVTRNITITPGGKKTISVSYRNTGDAPARGAAARIIGNQVLVPVSDNVPLGDLNPGETRAVSYVLSTDSALAGKEYVIETEVKYRDGLDALMLSDPLSFGVRVQDPTGPDAILSNPVLLIIIAGILVILAYCLWELRRRKQQVS
jgi:hypothetical protein